MLYLSHKFVSNNAFMHSVCVFCHNESMEAFGSTYTALKDWLIVNHGKSGDKWFNCPDTFTFLLINGHILKEVMTVFPEFAMMAKLRV